MARQKPRRVDIECNLHGLTREEALIELRKVESLLRRRGRGKARIIHGCGEILSELVYRFAAEAGDMEIAQERDNAGASILQLVR